MSAAVDTKSNGTTCGCGEGVESTAPVPIDNRPGLSAITYRIGTYGSFRAALVAALSRSDLPALKGLSTRDPSDFSLALLDAWATVGDVLTFYQERNANEAYLRTATERMSVAELAGLIGYAPRPGVAASTLLAFDLDNSLGAPATTVVDVGTKVQSIPGAGETPQTFETVEKVEARPVWDDMPPIQTMAIAVYQGQTSMYLAGTSTGLKVGDGVLILGGEKQHSPNSTNWDFRRLVTVTVDNPGNRTLIVFDEPLGKGSSTPAVLGVKVFAMRQRASLWGNNAMEFAALPSALTTGTSPTYTASTWVDQVTLDPSVPTDLDAVYPPVAVGSWVIMTQNTPPPPYKTYTEAYQVASVSEVSVGKYLLSGKCTQLTFVTDSNGKLPHFTYFIPRYASVFVQSEQLFMADGPYVLPSSDPAPSAVLTPFPGTSSPVDGNVITLGSFVDGISVGKTLIVNGPRAHVEQSYTLTNDKEWLYLVLADQSQIQLTYRQVLEMTAPPVPLGGTTVRFTLRMLNGREGTLTTDASNLVPRPPPAGAETVSEEVTVHEVDNKGATTKITLKDALQNSYDRKSLHIYGNIASATHGETVHEVLGSGNAGQSYQTFTLKQTPLTYVSAANATGASSTLVTTVNNVTWHEVDSLYAAGSADRVYVTSMADDGTVTLEFGDGSEGSRLPTGSANVLATYRKGIGLAGNLDAGRLTMLAVRPLGVRTVNNPIPATGGADPETLDSARSNAGLTIQTLDRVVSQKDYEAFARAFAGVAKASARWVWDGHERCVLITLAGAGGAKVDPVNDDMPKKLLDALRNAGDPFVPVVIASFQNPTFTLSAQVLVLPDHSADDVLPAVEAALRTAFSFSARSFAQPVTFSEVTTVIQNVTGVAAATVTALYRTDNPSPPAPPITMRLPSADATPPQGGGGAEGAELLTLDPGALGLSAVT